eukprot:m.15607 g.15607  ORF g.15607 m.15607 type:complete len:261 (+) comp26452_c0_seq2:83-865(+)
MLRLLTVRFCHGSRFRRFSQSFPGFNHRLGSWLPKSRPPLRQQSCSKTSSNDSSTGWQSIVSVVTSVTASVSAFLAVLVAWKANQTQVSMKEMQEEQNKTLRQWTVTKNTSWALQVYNERAGSCMADAGAFYKRHGCFSKKSKYEKEKCMRDAADEWAGLKAKGENKEAGRLNSCRQTVRAYFEIIYYMQKNKLIEEEMMQERFYANSGNFASLFEPLERANLATWRPDAKFENNRPTIFEKIEMMKNDPSKKEWLGDHT